MSTGAKGPMPTRDRGWSGIAKYLLDVYHTNRFRIDSFVVSIALRL